MIANRCYFLKFLNIKTNAFDIEHTHTNIYQWHMYGKRNFFEITKSCDAILFVYLYRYERGAIELPSDRITFPTNQLVFLRTKQIERILEGHRFIFVRAYILCAIEHTKPKVKLSNIILIKTLYTHIHHPRPKSTLTTQAFNQNKPKYAQTREIKVKFSIQHQ